MAPQVTEQGNSGKDTGQACPGRTIDITTYYYEANNVIRMDYRVCECESSSPRVPDEDRTLKS